MSDREVLRQVLGFLREAAGIARQGQQSSRAAVKADASLVTDVDLRLSELALKAFSGLAGEEAVVTEEHETSLLRLEQGQPPGGGELLVVIDPIDGTRNYAHRMPLYGISVGVLRNLVPWIGAVAFPALGELLYCDGTRTMVGRDLEEPEVAQQVLPPPAAALTHNSTLLCSDSILQAYHWDRRIGTLLVLSCATIEMCWPLLGRGSACLFRAHLWDLAGVWPMIFNLGFTLRGLRSGRELRRFDRQDYDPSSRKLKELAVMCRPELFGQIARGVCPNG